VVSAVWRRRNRALPSFCGEWTRHKRCGPVHERLGLSCLTAGSYSRKSYVPLHVSTIFAALPLNHACRHWRATLCFPHSLAHSIGEAGSGFLVLPNHERESAASLRLVSPVSYMYRFTRAGSRFCKSVGAPLTLVGFGRSEFMTVVVHFHNKQ